MSSIFREGVGKVCCRASVLAQHIHVEKPKKKGTGMILDRMTQRRRRRDTVYSIVLLLHSSADWLRVGSSKQGVGQTLLSILLPLWTAFFACA